MKRRNAALALATAPLLVSTLASRAWAAVPPVEGKDYSAIPAQRVAVEGKIEVLEFFGYWCPHCNHLEPKLDAWVKKLPPDVNFRRVPAGWQPSHEPYTRLFFALETMGVGNAFHAKVFDAVHTQHQRLESDEAVAAFAKANGLDAAKLIELTKGFSMANKVNSAAQLFKAYRATGVPTLAVNGRYITSPEQAGGEDQALQVVDALIVKARSGSR